MLKLLEQFCSDNNELEKVQSQLFIERLKNETILGQLEDSRQICYNIVRENADLKFRVSFLECKLKQYQDSNPVNSKGLDLNFSSISSSSSELNLALNRTSVLEPSYDVYYQEEEQKDESVKQPKTNKEKRLPPQPLPQNVGKTRSQRKNMKRKLKKK